MNLYSQMIEYSQPADNVRGVIHTLAFWCVGEKSFCFLHQSFIILVELAFCNPAVRFLLQKMACLMVNIEANLMVE